MTEEVSYHVIENLTFRYVAIPIVYFVSRLTLQSIYPASMAVCQPDTKC